MTDDVDRNDDATSVAEVSPSSDRTESPPRFDSYNNVFPLRPPLVPLPSKPTTEDVARELRQQRSMILEIGGRLLDHAADTSRKLDAIMELLKEALSR